MTDESEIIRKAIKAIEALSDQTAVHRKKFELALSQLRKFCKELLLVLDGTNGKYQKEVLVIKSYFLEFRDILTQNLLQTWSIPTVENPSDFVIEKILEILTKIKVFASEIKQELADSINLDQEKWNQYNILDLRAIQASFTQYISMKDIDPELSKSIEKRLASIDEYLSSVFGENESHRVFSPIPIHYQSWKVDISDFTEEKEIGGGVSAVVYYGIDKRNGEKVAIKKFKFKKLNGSRLQTFQREVAVLATARHPTLLRLVGATDVMPFAIITEWMPNNSLYHDIHIHHRLDQTLKTIAAFDIARGMQFLHSHQIVHRDLKSLNVLLDSDFHIRICDFGFSRHASEDSFMTQNIGTPHWMAPELLGSKTSYTSKIDVYAYGIVLWEIATGSIPYNGMDAQHITSQVLHDDIRPALPTEINPVMRDLITQCWDRNPDVRPSFDEIIKRFQRCDLAFNGTNMDEFQQYMDESATTTEQIQISVLKIINDILSKSIHIEDGIMQLEKHGIPPALLDKAWSIISEIDMENQFSQYLSRFLVLFYTTSYLSESTKLLRKIPKGLVPPDIMTKFIEELPTGSIEVDTNIVVAACRNGQHDLCSLYASNPSDIALIFEVISCKGTCPQLQQAVNDKCVQSLKSSSTLLKLSALRCLVSMKQHKRIPMPFLVSSLSSDNPILTQLTLIASSLFLYDNQRIPQQILIHCIEHMEDNECASSVVLFSTQNEDDAGCILDYIHSKYLEPKRFEHVIKSCSMHQSQKERTEMMLKDK